MSTQLWGRKIDVNEIVTIGISLRSLLVQGIQSPRGATYRLYTCTLCTRSWTHLRHFGLSRFAVRHGDLISFLEALPPTLRSVQLSFLFFLEGCYRDLVADMRDRLGWRKRPVEQRRRVSIGLPDVLDDLKRRI